MREKGLKQNLEESIGINKEILLGMNFEGLSSAAVSQGSLHCCLSTQKNEWVETWETNQEMDI